MKISYALLLSVFIGQMSRILGKTANNFNQTYHRIHRSRSPPEKRNTKFLIPALISHMYHQKLDESPLSTMLNRPFAKRVGKQDNGKRESGETLEHRTIVGSPTRDEHVRNVPKTKCPTVKTKETPVLVEIREDKRSNDRHSGANGDKQGNVVEVSKHFGPLSRNWYGGPPSVMWPPPVPYKSYEQYPNPRFSRPLYGSSLPQEGFMQHIMGPPRNKFTANNNVVAQERKFMVTNITKYVLDFYCPHCGGEISVSKNRNRGGIFGSDQGAITINKGPRDPNESKPQAASPNPKKTKRQHSIN